MPTERFADRIVRHLARQGYQPQKIHKLARAMGIADEEYGDFRGALKALMKTGRIVMGSASALTLPDPARRVVGRFRSNPRGFGFVIPDTPNSHGDLFVPPGHSRDAVTGDTVAAEVLRRGKRDGRLIYEGRIVEIIERGQSRYVGELCRELKRWFVRPDGNILHVPIFVGDPGAKRARSGDQVVVEIIEYPLRGRDGRGPRAARAMSSLWRVFAVCGQDDAHTVSRQRRTARMGSVGRWPPPSRPCLPGRILPPGPPLPPLLSSRGLGF